jgi:hypothetical protein
MDPVVCTSCGARFPLNGVTDDEYRALCDSCDQDYYTSNVETLRELHNVEEYCRRHPHARARIRAGFAPQTEDPAYEDWLAVEYLRHHDQRLGPLGLRIKLVTAELDRLKASVGTVRCPRCESGRLAVAPEGWNAFTAREAAWDWFWPEYYSLADDGTLHTCASGWYFGAHWSGVRRIRTDDTDYDFWRWLVGQKEYHRLVDDRELQSIGEEWSRLNLRCGTVP